MTKKKSFLETVLHFFFKYCCPKHKDYSSQEFNKKISLNRNEVSPV